MERLSISLKSLFTDYTHHDRNNWVKLASDYLASIFAYFIVRLTSWSPNRVTFFSLLFGTAAAVSIFFDSLLLFGLFYYISFVLDYTDGKIASIRKMGSPLGQKFDIWTDRTVLLFVSVGISCFFYRHGHYYDLLTYLVFVAVFLYADFIEISQQRYEMLSGSSIRDKKERRLYTKGDWYRGFFKIKQWYPVRGVAPIFAFVVAPLVQYYSGIYVAFAFFILLQLAIVMRNWTFRSYDIYQKSDTTVS